MGSIADIMKLQGVSRSLAFYGLKYLAKTDRVGLRELFIQTGLSDASEFTSYDIGFKIGPRINAAGRVDSAIKALQLLCTTDKARAQQLSAELEQHNRTRQKMVEKQMIEAEAQIGDQKDNLFAPVTFRP